MVDTLAILNNIRLLKDVKDGGAHLAYEMMNNLNKYRNKNYYDETSGGCHSAMDKIIELYKENEHGTELVKDIEKVLNLQVREDETTPSSRAKEYLKQTLNIIKGV
jgi:type I site-specific restriction endonuclease